MKIIEFWFKFHWSLFSVVQLTIFQITTWYQSGDKPLNEPMMAKFIDTYKHHSALMSRHLSYGIYF